MKLQHKLWNNPVLIKETRTRMRGSRAFILLTSHLLILSLIIGLIYVAFQSSFNNLGSLDDRRIFSKVIFGVLIGLEMMAVSFTAPALTSGMITTERERQTYDLLRVTLLPARSLVVGKFASGLIFILLLLFTSIPILSPAFLFGGVTPQEIFIGVLVLAVTAIAFCAVGTFLSSLLSRTLVSTVLSYAFAIFTMFGIPLFFLITIIVFNASFSGSTNQIAPDIMAILVFGAWILISTTPLGTIAATELIMIDQHSIWLYQITLENDIKLVLISPWILYVILYLIFSIGLILMSIYLVKRMDN